MTDHQQSFDLRTQPWVQVRRLDGVAEQLSLYDLFARAHELHGVTGDLPTQAFAVYRLLLALLHRGLPADGRKPVERWRALWDNGRLPHQEIERYLERYADRFDLLHPITPFYQVAELRTAKDITAGLTSLIADVPTGHQYFTTRAGEGLERIDYAEATRWVVHLQAYDPSGIKSGAVGDDRVKAGKGYPIGTSWVGGFGGVLIEGRSLFETLLLNLVLTDPNGIPTSGPNDRPTWERAHLGPGIEDRGGAGPAGVADLLTWQSRRVRLVNDGAGVTGVVVANGDPLAPQNMHVVEPMCGWRRSQPQEKKLKIPLVYMPRPHRPGRSVWRGLAALLPQQEFPDPHAGARDSLSPGVLEWIRSLEDEDAVDASLPLRTRVVGMTYGSNNSVVEEVVDDAVLLLTAVVANSSLRAAAVRAVEEADATVSALANLAGNLAIAAGGETEPARTEARELGFSRLDNPYRTWVAALGPSTDLVWHRGRWHRELRTHVGRLGADLIGDAGIPAWVGRERQGRRIDAGIAEAWFSAALRKAVPLAYPPAADSTHEDHPPDTNQGSAA